MRDAAGWPAFALTIVVAAGMVVLGISNRHVPAGPDAAQWLRQSVSAALMAAPAGLLAARRPANPVGWLLLGASFLLALSGLTTQYGVYAIATHPGLPGGRWALWVTRLTALVDLIPPLLLLYFPTGRLASRRSRILVLVAVTGGVTESVAGAFYQQPLIDPAPPGPLAHLASPLRIGMSPGLANVLLVGGIAATLLSLVPALAGLVLRYRRAAGTERAQMKWFAYSAAVLVASLLASPAIHGVVSTVCGVLATGLLPAALAIAILKYRLYDIDLIINRTLVYAGLSAMVAGLYVAVVVGFGALVRLKSSLAFDLLATGLIAALFSPARDRLQRLVDRVMYRDRPDSYRVLARLGERLAAAAVPEEVLPGVARTVAEALRLPYAAVETAGPDGGTTLASYGELSGERTDLPLAYHGQRVGTLIVGRRGRDPLTQVESDLLADLGRQAGVAVHAVALTADLHKSRERLVAAREEERRRLRRDLHDGLGPTLAAIGMRADAARRAIHDDPTAAEQAMAEIKADAQLAVSDVRRLVQNLRPPVLDELGLVGAIRAAAERYQPGLDITVEAPSSPGELPAGVEVAAFRIVSEALANVVKHAGASHAQVRIARGADRLELDIRDDGAGYEPKQAGTGLGMSTMVERAQELGGTCLVTSEPGAGTHVAAALPLPVSEQPPGQGD